MHWFMLIVQLVATYYGFSWLNDQNNERAIRMGQYLRRKFDEAHDDTKNVQKRLDDLMGKRNY